MSSIEFTNIETLVTNDPGLGAGRLGEATKASLIVEAGKVAWVGSAVSSPGGADRRVDCSGRTLIPGFVDSHTHLAFAGDRSLEFQARMAGQPYSAGGIVTTVDQTRSASDEQLRANLRKRQREMTRNGITTFESKTGYGLTVDEELRLLRLTKEFTDEVTLLAHVVPTEMGESEFVATFVNQLVAQASPVARWVDVFCDQGAFSTDAARTILTAAKSAGLGLRIHAAQLQASDSVAMAVDLDVASIDHCNHLTSTDIEAIAGSRSVATLLPAADFSTRAPYAPARALLDSGATVALATNCNPGSSFTTSMAFCIAVAVREMAMTVSEALWSATAGGAAALRRSDIGHLGVGARADMTLLEAPNYVHLAYRPGMDLIDAVYQGGIAVYERSS